MISSRRDFLKTGSAAVMAAIMGCQKQQKPNILFILVDDLGWTDLDVYGSRFYETPNLKRLAAEGMRFTQAYSASPVCSPTRAAIMSGKHPARLNITDWIPGLDPRDRKLLGPHDRHQLPLNETTIAETLKKAGYHTLFAGKWHLGAEGYYPEQQGFDINKGGHEKGSPSGGYYVPYNNPKLQDGATGEYLTDRLTDETIDFMQTHTPFFAFLSFYTVHTPIQACKRHHAYYLNKLEKKTANSSKAYRREGDGWTKLKQDRTDYASMVAAMDENIGRLLDHLQKSGLKQNSVIVFTSDNGGLSTLYRKNAPTSTLPLRAGKGWCYEGGIRVPLILCAPGITQPETVCKTPVTSMDFYPTLLELCGLPLKPDQHVDGKSLVPLLKRKTKSLRRNLYWHYPHYHGSAWEPGAAIRQQEWKLIEFYQDNRLELYNLSEDIGEQNDLAKQFPQKTDSLRQALLKWQKRVNAQLPSPNQKAK